MKRFFFGLLAIYCFSTSASTETPKALEIMRSGRTDHYAFKSMGNPLYKELKTFIEKYGNEDLVCYRIEAVSAENAKGESSFVQLKSPLTGCEIGGKDLDASESVTLGKIMEKIPGSTTGNLVANNASAKIEGLKADSIYLKVFKITLVSGKNDCKSAEDDCYLTLNY